MNSLNLALLLLNSYSAVVVLPTVEPVLFTSPVSKDADDPAIFYNGTRSLVVGTDKEGKVGGLYVWNLEGKQVSRSEFLDRPNNVDLVENFQMGNQTGTLVLATERYRNRLVCFILSKSGKLTNVTGDTGVLLDRDQNKREPMGVVAWKTRSSQALSVVITPKEGPKSEHNEFGNLVWNPKSKLVDFKHKFNFGYFSGAKETESTAIDPSRSFLAYSDETKGVWVYNASDAGLKSSPIRMITNPLHTGDHEGLAFWKHSRRGLLLISTDQRDDESVYWVYHVESGKLLGGFKAPIDQTDGIELCARPMGPKFPKGIMVAMNSIGKNFAYLSLKDIEKALDL